MARFRKYQATLRSREDEMQEKIDICQAELNSRKFSKAAASVPE